MGVHNLNNGIDIDKAKYERLNRINPPEYAPGQDLKAISMGDLFGNGAKIMDNSPQDVNIDGFADPFEDGDANPFNSFGGSQSMGDPFQQMSNPMLQNNLMMPQNNSFGGFNTGNSFGPSANGMISPYQQQSQGLTYEKAEELMVQGAKGLKSIILSFGKVTPLFWYNYLTITRRLGWGLIGASLLFLVLGVGNPFDMFIAGFILAVGSLGTAMIIRDKAEECTSEYKEEPVEMKPNNIIDMPMPPTDFTSMVQMPVNNNEDDEILQDSTEEITLDNIEESDFNLDDIIVESEIVKEDPEVVLNTMQDIPKGMYTRQYLFETFTKLLPNVTSDFGTFKEITDDDNSFYEVETAIKEAAEVTGCKEPIELKKVKENYATVVIITTRPTGLKLEATANELAHIYAYRAVEKEEDRDRVYAKAEAVGKECIFTIFTGATQMISLKDMYEVKDVREYVLDSRNYIPIVFGIDSMDKVIYYDLKKLESIIVAGMPRSGKSWFVQNMITQMTAFLSPKELHLYICDPKGDISDFKAFCLPHVKKFETTDKGILDTLRFLVKVEAPRRKKLIGAGNNLTASQNIWDYKDRHPEVELPIIYVVIDEVVTLASRMEKEVFSEFRMILRELISQLPALGIRAIMIPHVLKNDIIEKKTSDIVLCRISICGSAEHIETVTGAKEKEFPYVLTKPGDMAVSMPPVRQGVMYLRAPILNKENDENNLLFDYMRRVWTKLEPDSVKDSVARFVEEDKAISECLAKEDEEDFDIFETEEKDSNNEARDFMNIMNS